MPKHRRALTIDPKWKIPPNIASVYPPGNVRDAAEAMHMGSKFVAVGRLKGPQGGETGLWRIDFPNAARDKRPGLSAERLAQIVTAMCLSDAQETGERGHYFAVFHGMPTEADPRPRQRVQFTCDPPGGPREEEETEEEDDDEDDEEEEEDEEDEDEDEETEEGLEVEDATITWPQSEPAGMRSAPMGAPAPGVRPPYPTHGLTALHPSLRGDPRFSASLGPMVGPPDPYAREPNDPGALFLRHLGGVFAETRATMREMREDVRESRAETRNANARVLNLAGMSTAHYENMHKASQFGWNALHQGMQMQLNALQNSMAWERRIVQTEHAQQPSGFMQALPMLVPLLLGLGGQIIHAIRGGEGPPPQLMDPTALQAIMGGMVGMGEPPPGGMPPGAPPGPVPPGAGVPSSPPPPPGFGAPGAAPPPPGFAAPPAPPFGSEPQATAPQHGPTQPGFAGPIPTPPPFPDANHGPAPGFAPAPGPPPGVAGPDTPPMAPTVPEPPAPQSSAFVGGPSVPMSAVPDGPFTAPIPAQSAGPFAPMESSPPPPRQPPIDTTARPSRQELDARFTRAPIGTMCHTLLLTAGPVVTRQIEAAAGADVVQLLQECGGAYADDLGAGSMHALHQRLSQPGAMEAAMGQMATTEQRALLTDIYQGITQRLSQRAVAGTTPAPSPPAPAEPPPGLGDPTVLPPPPATRAPPKPRSKSGKKKKKKKRGF